MSSVLKIEQGAFETAKNAYLGYAQEMETLKKGLTDSVSGLRSGWKSDAGDEFFKKFDDEWTSIFNDYIAVIKHMALNAQIAETKYQSVFDEADGLNL